MTDLFAIAEPESMPATQPAAGGVSKFNAHDRTAGKDEWFTPREITDALGPFDLDPCTATSRPHEIAPRIFTAADDGLKQNWGGEFVFCNPPYGIETRRWYAEMARHNHGIMLTFARTETEMFHQHVWGKANAILFLRGRVKFIERACARCGRGQSIHANPKTAPKDHAYEYSEKFVRGEASAGSPSVLVAYGQLAYDRLLEARGSRKLDGYFAKLCID